MYSLERYRIYSREIYFWLLSLLVVSLLFYRQLMVISQALLIVNWLLEGNLQQKFKTIYRRKSILIFLAIYFVHIIWLINSSDIKTGFTSSFMKLPLFILPIIMGTSEPLPNKKIKQILQIFISAVIVSTFISALILFGVLPIKINDVRDISVFISHIRLSLMIVVSVFILSYWLITEFRSFNRLHLLYILSCFWLFFSLVLLKSLTGITILFITTFLLIIINIKSVKNHFFKIGLIMILYAIPIFSIVYIISALDQYNEKDKIDFEKLDKYTINRNSYSNDTLDGSMENGHYTWIYYCANELKREWNKRSIINIDSCDSRKQPIIYTLIRYMTSKGLRKDSAGIWNMAPKDIKNVESGITNEIFAKKYSIYPRIYEVIWEIDRYKKDGDANGSSITQRLVYIKMSLDIIKTNLFFGMGTSDAKSIFKQYYKSHNTGLQEQFQHDSHNQYLRFLILFGITGFLIVIATFIIPPVLEKKWTSYYFVMFFIVMLLSFINEDAIETQVGVTFTAFFYSFFLWGFNTIPDNGDTTGL